VTVCAGALIWPGCAEKPAEPAIGYYLGPRSDLAQVKQVVFVELSEKGTFPGVAEDMTVALSHAIHQRRLFRIDVIDREDPRCKTLSLQDTAAFTIKQLHDMRKAFGCDAVLLGQVRDFRPHPRMQIWLYLRLLDLKEGKLLWAVDQTWDTTDKATEKRMKKFFDKQMQTGLEPIEWELVKIGPKTFQKFVSHEVAATLPSRAESADGDNSGRWTTTEMIEKVRKPL